MLNKKPIGKQSGILHFLENRCKGSVLPTQIR